MKRLNIPAAPSSGMLARPAPTLSALPPKILGGLTNCCARIGAPLTTGVRFDAIISGTVSTTATMA